MTKMSFASRSLVLLLSVFAIQGADKNAPFKPGPTDSYPCRQTQEKVTIAVQPFDTAERTRLAFDKLDPNRYGVLPVLVIIRNDGPGTLMLDGLRVEYITEARQKVEAIPAREVAKVNAPGRPRMSPSPLPTQLPRTGPKKNPLADWVIEGRAFAAKALPPGELASGFFYFEASHRSGASLYITGLRDASTKRELFYFEIPLDAQGR
jgi:hypothetical protein